MYRHNNIDNQEKQDKNFIENSKIIEKRTNKKIKNLKLAKAYMDLGYEKKGERVYNCNNYLVFAKRENENIYLKYANFCEDRLCPICSMHRSNQIFGQVSKVMNVVQEKNTELTPLFLTLTIRNCKAKDLKKALDSLFEGWHRMFSSKAKSMKTIVGWFRALEITYNEKTNRYHPHIHAILLVSSEYFEGQNYMTTRAWVQRWRKSLRLDYDPTCWIEKIETENQSKGMVAEVAKYTIKDSDYLDFDEKTTKKLVKVFSENLKYRRLIAFGGIMKEIAKELKLDFENFDLENQEMRRDVSEILYFYRWHVGISKYKFDLKLIKE